MNSTYRQIFRHAGVFGAGAVLFRLASVVLLPLYMRYLAPSDYGVMALLDVTINLLAIVVGAGIASAATRAHFGESDCIRVGRVWWTAILCEMAIASVVVAPIFALRNPLSALVFGAGVDQGAYYVTLAVATLWITSVTTVVDSYFRAGKKSAFIVGIGLLRLLINIALNVVFVVGYGMGVAGVLWGNLLSSVVSAVVECTPFVVSYRAVSFDREMARGYWSFGAPLIVYGLCSTIMHESDRFALRLFVDLHDLGLYSLAYQIGQGVNTLVMVPFTTIWSVLIYEIAGQRDAKRTYARVFQHYVYALSLVLLLASLFAGPVLGVVAPPEYAGAAGLVPIVCLAYFFFSIHDHFKVPALLAGRTAALLPAVVAAAASNLALNLLMIPRMGVAGAAWASVVTFALFASVGLVRNRRIDRYPYPFATCAFVVSGMAATYAAHRALVGASNLSVQLAVGGALWLGWAAFLFGGNLKQLRLATEPAPPRHGDLSGRDDVVPPSRAPKQQYHHDEDGVEVSPIAAGLNER